MLRSFLKWVGPVVLWIVWIIIAALASLFIMALFFHLMQNWLER